MAGELEIRPLRSDDDRSAFTCGQPEIDRFFQHYAGQNQFKLHLAVTYGAVLEARILGYATVSVGSLERRTPPSTRMRKRLPGYPLPMLRLARLAVDARSQGLGVGRALLRRILSLALELRESLGCIGVVTDAKPEAVAFYAKYGFEPLEGVREGALPGGAAPFFLPLRTVAEARER